MSVYAFIDTCGQSNILVKTIIDNGLQLNIDALEYQ